MIVRALLLRQHIDYFCYHHRSIKENDDGLHIEQMLTPDDWLILTQLAEGLKVFHTATIALEGQAKDAKFGAMWECVPVLEVLSNNLIRLQDEYPLINDVQDDRPHGFRCSRSRPSWSESCDRVHVRECQSYLEEVSGIL